MVIVKQRKKKQKIIHKKIKPCKKLQGFFYLPNPRRGDKWLVVSG